MATNGVQPLSAEQVRELYSNSTSYHQGDYYEFAGYYSVDGVKNGKSWGDWGKESDQGSWYVTSEGHLCGKWHGSWAKGERCLVIYPGKTENAYIEAVVVGPLYRSNPSGVYQATVISGDYVNTESLLAAEMFADE